MVPAEPASSAPRRPVVSVSPARAAGDEAFVTPRVLDQSSFDDLAGMLRALIGEARSASRELDDRLGADPAAASAAPAQLQERLRLGARMMKAFQNQIDRVAEVSSELDERERRLETILATLETRLAADAGRRAEREQRVDPVDERIADLESRIAGVTQLLETAEINAAALGHRVATARQRTEEQEASAESLAARCDAAVERMAKATASGERLGGAMKEHVESAGAAEKRLAAGLRDVTKAIESLEPRLLVCERLEHALERLAPWEGLLQGACDREGTPIAVTKAVEAARAGVGHDLTRLAVTMRELAERFEAFEPPPKKDPATQDLRAVIEGKGKSASASSKKPAAGTRAKPAATPQEIESKTSLRFRDHVE
jgi:uncharacterized coiled-coil protein SlyX